MNQIDKFIIQNFQCHPETVIEPASTGLTVITGPTDHGKSSVVRALRWLFYNRPQGDDFIRHGADECKVSVELEDGTVVVRRRTKSLNQYYVNGDIFEGFGNKVPMEVQQALGIYHYEIADEILHLNIAEQLAAPFLGSSITAPTRAKILGKLAGTEVIDKASKQLGTDIYRAGQDKKKLEADIKEKNQKLEKYSWVKPLGKILQKAKNKFEQIQRDKDRLEQLKELRDELNDTRKKKKLINGKLFMFSRLDQAQFKLKETKQDIQFHDTLKIYADKWIELTNQRADIKENLFKLKQLKEAKINVNTITYNSAQTINLNHIRIKLLSVEEGKEKIIDNLHKLTKTTEANQSIQSILLNINELEKADRIHDKLHELNFSRQEINSRLDQVINFGKARQRLVDIESGLTALNDLRDNLDHYSQLRKKISEFRKVISEKKQKIGQVKQIAIQSREKYEKLLDEMGICPTCGADQRERKLERVI